MKLTKLSTVSLITVLTLGFITSSCNSVKDLIKFNLPAQTIEVDFEIPPTATGEKSLADFNVRFNVDSAIKANASQFSAANIKSAKIISVKVETSNAEQGGDHLGALSAAKAQLSSSGNSTLVTIAELTDNPATFAASLTLPVKDVELKDYFKDSNFTYVLSGTVRTATTTTLRCKAIIKFDASLSL